jgi:hypothetical protein
MFAVLCEGFSRNQSCTLIPLLYLPPAPLPRGLNMLAGVNKPSGMPEVLVIVPAREWLVELVILKSASARSNTLPENMAL